LATVIDSLLIELGLDTSKFDAAQKKSVEQLRKFDEANQKTQKNLQRTSKDTAEGFIKARDALISFGSAFTAAGFVNFVNNVNSANASLTRNAGMLGVSTKELTGWGNAVKSAGGKAESLVATVSKLQGLAAARFLGNSTLRTQMSQLGIRSESINPETGAMNLQKLSEDIKNYESRYNLTGEQAASNFAPLIDRDTFMLLDKGPAAAQKLIDIGIKKAALDEKAAKKALELDNAERQLGNSFDALKTKIVSDVNPAMMGLVSTTESVFTKFNEIDDATNGALGKFTALSIGVIGLAGAFKTLSIALETELAKSLGLGWLARLLPVAGELLALPVATSLMAAGLDKYGGGSGAHTEGGIDTATGKIWHWQAKKGGKGFEWVLKDNPNGNTPSRKWVGGKRGSGGHWEDITSTSSSSDLFSNLEKQYGLPAGMLGKIMQIESHGDTNAINPDSGAMGAFQFMPKTARQYGVANPFDINESATGATKFLHDLSKHYNGDVDKMLAGYNWGMGKVDTKGMGMMPNETRNYLSKYHAMTGSSVSAPPSSNNSNISTNISMGNITLPNVTDSQSFVQSLQEKFQTNSLLNYGIAGAR